MKSRRIQLQPQNLVEWRTAKGITLHEIIETTKISPRYLEAIERGDFRELPGGVYTESYIRQYALAIDDTENVLLDYYRSVIAAEKGPPLPVTETRPRRLLDLLLSIAGLAPERPVRLETRW